MPVVGKNMLIVLPFGWVVCARVAERGKGDLKLQFKLENCHVICRTNGVPWDELATGVGDRKKPTYRKWGDCWVGPEFVISCEWQGELPDGSTE